MQFDPSAFVADPELFRALEERSAPVSCAEEQVLFQQDEPPVGLYILQKGEATLSLNDEDGQPIMVLNMLPGSLLGLPGILGDQPYSMTAVAQAGAQVGFVTRADFNDLMQAKPDLSLKMLQVLAAEVRTARRALY